MRTTLIAPACSCCHQPQPLIPRDDLEQGFAACPATGQLYRPVGHQYLPTEPPNLETQRPSAPRVRIDLSSASYA